MKTLMRPVWCSLVVGALWGLVVTPALAAPAIDLALDYFYDADFELALETLDEALAGGQLEPAATQEAHVVRARCHARLGAEKEAMDAYCEVVALNPAWNPNPAEFSSHELALFRRALARCPLAVVPAEPERATELASPVGGSEPLAAAAVDEGGSWYRSKKLWIGAGALFVLLAVAGGEDDPEAEVRDRVPDFPDPPNAPSPTGGTYR